MDAITEERLEELLRQRYGLEPKAGMLKVRDGYVAEGDKVWWRGSTGPEHVRVDYEHIRNIRDYPNVYQIAKPKIEVTYLD